MIAVLGWVLKLLFELAFYDPHPSPDISLLHLGMCHAFYLKNDEWQQQRMISTISTILEDTKHVSDVGELGPFVEARRGILFNIMAEEKLPAASGTMFLDVGLPENYF